MGKVLRLAAARRLFRSRPREETVGKETAQIVLFTGVRREYLPGHPLHDDAQPGLSRRGMPKATKMPASTNMSAATARQEKDSPRASTPSR